MFGRHSQDFSSTLHQQSQLSRRPQLALSQLGGRGAGVSSFPRSAQIELGNVYSDIPKPLGPRHTTCQNKAMGLGGSGMVDETVVQLQSELARLQDAYTNLLKEISHVIQETRQESYQMLIDFKKENDKTLHEIKSTMQKMLDTCPGPEQDAIDPGLTYSSMMGC